MIPIQFLIQRRIIVLQEGASVSQASDAMCKNAVGSVLITNSKGHLVGVVTDRDLACSEVLKRGGDHVSIAEIMTPRPLFVEPSADVEFVVHLMEESGIRRIPVVEKTPDGDHKPIGLITLDDLIASKMIDSDDLARVVRSQIRRRALPFTRRGLKEAPSVTPIKRHRTTLKQFYHEIQESTGLSDQHLVTATDVILSSIVRRLYYTGAAHLISQLPDGLQERLLDLPPGPDAKITANSLVSELSRLLEVSPEEVNALLVEFYEGLEHVLSKSETRHLRTEISDLMPPSRKKGRKSDAA